MVVVATDVAARGLQIDTLATVVHYDAARNIGTFVHRSGRTAVSAVPWWTSRVFWSSDGWYGNDEHNVFGLESLNRTCRDIHCSLGCLSHIGPA